MILQKQFQHSFAIAIMPFSYSIANGIAAAMIFYPIVKVFTGRHKECHPIVYILSVIVYSKIYFTSA